MNLNIPENNCSYNFSLYYTSTHLLLNFALITACLKNMNKQYN